MSAWTYRCQSAGKAAPKIVPLRSRTPCWKGLCADSEEKREPVSDINTAMVESLKALDPKRPIREADISRVLLEDVRDGSVLRAGELLARSCRGSKGDIACMRCAGKTKSGGHHANAQTRLDPGHAG